MHVSGHLVVLRGGPLGIAPGALGSRHDWGFRNLAIGAGDKMTLVRYRDSCIVIGVLLSSIVGACVLLNIHSARAAGIVASVSHGCQMRQAFFR